jgi:hypothetical protein
VDDKRFQVQNMSRIYKNATAVFVMFGGCAAAQGLQHTSQYLERAWTLQESTINKDTYGLFDMSAFQGVQTQDSFTIASVGAKGRRLDGGIGLVKIRDLLKIDVNQPLGRITYPEIPEQNSPYYPFPLRCFGQNLQAVQTMKIVFDGIHKDDRNEAVVKSAAWTSIWMRTSSKPQDMVFSLMHLLGVELTVDYNRSLEDLFLELVCKSSETPVWLTIAPQTDVTAGSYVIPVLPQFRPHKLPFYVINHSEEPASSRLSDLEGMMAWTDIIVHSSLDPQTFKLCGTVMTVHQNSEEYATNRIGGIRRDLHFSSEEGEFRTHCIIFRDIGGIAMVAGQSWKGSRGSDSINDVLIIFLDRSKSGVWKKVGQGIVSIREREKKILAKVKRKHIEMGCANEIDICNCWQGDNRGQFQFPTRVPFRLEGIGLGELIVPTQGCFESPDVSEMEQREKKLLNYSPFEGT